MKIYFRLPGGIEFYMERNPRPSMKDGHFNALVYLAAGAMVWSIFLAMVFM